MSQPDAYAKRLIHPFSGVVQVVENDNARALSLDGEHWEIQFSHEATGSFFGRKGDSSPMRRYARVAQFNNERGLRTYPLHPALDAAQVDLSCTPIIKLIPDLKIPMEIKDNYEYWLLDENDQKPLALIFSCCKPEEFEKAPYLPHWNAIPAAQFDLQNTDEEIEKGLPPPSYRLEQLVKKRAGQNPLANWYKRRKNGDAVLIRDGIETDQIVKFEYFPEYLIREDWESDEAENLCHRYLQRLSPRLLMLQRLSHNARDRAETLANAFALDVEKYFHLYPQIANEERMVAIRVEAQLRRSLGACPRTRSVTKITEVL